MRIEFEQLFFHVFLFVAVQKKGTRKVSYKKNSRFIIYLINSISYVVAEQRADKD